MSLWSFALLGKCQKLYISWNFEQQRCENTFLSGWHDGNETSKPKIGIVALQQACFPFEIYAEARFVCDEWKRANLAGDFHHLKQIVENNAVFLFILSKIDGKKMPIFFVRFAKVTLNLSASVWHYWLHENMYDKHPNEINSTIRVSEAEIERFLQREFVYHRSLSQRKPSEEIAVQHLATLPLKNFPHGMQHFNRSSE